MQEVIGSTPIFSTQTLNVPGVQLFSNTPGTNSAKTLPQHANFGGMESAEVTYTTPRLFKGKTIDLVPKGSTKAREEAKQSWYVFVFYLLEKYQQKKNPPWDNYSWSSLLKVSETKVKNLRLQVGISYTADDENYEIDMWIALLDLFREGYIHIDGEKYVITIENPLLLRFIEHQLKVLKMAATDYSFNKEIVKFKKDSIELLVKTAGAAIGIAATYAKSKIDDAKWKGWKERTSGKLLDLLTESLPHVILKMLFPAA
jgi:hypothetical protein